MRPLSTWAVVIAVLGSFTPSLAQAQVIDFTSGDFNSVYSTGPFGEPELSYLEDGFLIQWSPPTSAIPGANRTLEVSGGPASFYIRSVDGSTAVDRSVTNGWR